MSGRYMGSPIATGFGKTVVQGSPLLTCSARDVPTARRETGRDVLAIRMRSSSEPSTQEVLAGLVEWVTFHNAENGFCVLQAKARGHRDLVTVIGHAAIISAGEWINDRVHGQQFSAWHRHVATRRARTDYKGYGFSCGRDDLAPRGHRRGAKHAL
jgi:hypothetical protein